MLCSIAKAQRVSTNIKIERQEQKITKTEAIKIDVTKTDNNSLTNKLIFFGFDKPLNSAHESFFITNTLDIDIAGVDLEIEYLTTDSLPLHKRIVKIECNVPKKETRKVDIESWDKQKSFYYHKSSKPRKQATSFLVRFRLISYYIVTDTRPNLID